MIGNGDAIPLNALSQWAAIAAIGGYLIGSIPFGVLISHLFYGGDIRNEGSGNIGAANALRTYGAAGGVAVLVLDLLKGYAATAFAQNAIDSLWSPPFYDYATIAGVGAVVGHCYSPWIHFRGGKGVATYLGVIFALSWVAGVVFVLIWLAVALPTRFASLGSLCAAVTSPIALGLATQDLAPVIGGVGATALIVFRHRQNIARLRAGTEHRLQFGRGHKGDQESL